MPYSAVCIGAVGAVFAFLWVSRVKPRLGVDDALDVAALQGVPGIVGSIAVGFAAEYKIEGAANLGVLVGGNGTLLYKQCVAVVVTVLWTAFFTWLLMRFMRRFVGIDVSPEAEEKGLDFVQIGEQAYDETLAPILDLGVEVLTAKLIDAAKAGNLARVKALVQAGAPAEAADYDGRSAMHLAAASGHVDILQYLQSQHGCDISAVDRYGNTPLHDAIANNETKCVAWLKSNGARAITNTGYVKNRDILQAAADGNLEEVKWRLQQSQKEARARGRGGSVGSLLGGTKVRDNDIVNLQDYDRRTPLHVAACEGHSKVVRELLRAGADPNMRDRWGMTPMAGAVQMRQQKTAEELHAWINRHHESRDDVELIVHQATDEVAGGGGDSDSSMLTPLLSSSGSSGAAREGQGGESAGIGGVAMPHAEMSVDARALITAAERGDKTEICKLLAKGADVNQKDYDGRSAMHLACASNHLEVVQILIKKGATLDVFDRFGRTPLQDALDMHHTQIACILRSAGATVTNPFLARKLCRSAADADLDMLAQIEVTGGNLACSDYDGRTALHLAASNGHVEVCKWLLARGVRPTSVDRFGGTPLDDAEREGHMKIVQMISEHLSHHTE
jgi:ankyrin repeat protein